MKEYAEDFSNWKDVTVNFAFEGTEPNHIYAYYGCVDYDGDAVVAFYKNRKFYVVEGGHCSCYGLEGQWEPVEYTRSTYKAMLDRLPNSGYGAAGQKAKLLELYEATK